MRVQMIGHACLLCETIPAGLLEQVLTDPDGWETLGIPTSWTCICEKGRGPRKGF